jgi:capsule biosynthesis phosphatase
MNIIIPIGGLGIRFKKNGYTKPKPLININGEPMIKYIVNSLKLTLNDKLIIIFNKELNNFNFKSYFPNNTIFYELNIVTKGVVETIFNFFINYNIINLHKTCVICDCDTFYKIDVLAKIRNSINNNIISFAHNNNDPIYSYNILDNNNKIVEIKEKKIISNIANCGIYCFNDINNLFNYCKKTIDSNYMYNNEFYLSCLINLMIKDNHIFESVLINFNDFVCLGTPLQLKSYSIQNNSYNKKRFCFNIDNTLLINNISDSSKFIPLEKNINYLKFLKNLNHTIILYTSTGMNNYSNNIGKIMQNDGILILKTLEEFEIPYDEIYFGKPYADYYIDNLAINSNYDLEKETGFYQNKIHERSFNNISIDKMDIIIKKGNINGEIYYYKNIPNKIKYLFPIFINHTDDSLIIEKINAINFSHLFIKECLTTDIFILLLEKINIIHTIDLITDNNIPNNDNILNHYINRLETRFKNPLYNNLNNSSKIYNILNNFFINYKNECIIRIVHGDPVFTNILLNEKNIKFIDMRGILDTEFTIYGDIFYDYAKIYQSILGYDEIMHDIYISNQYKCDLTDILFSFIRDKYGEKYINYIKIITYSHIFTLLPLHNYNKAINYYNLINFEDLNELIYSFNL